MFSRSSLLVVTLCGLVACSGREAGSGPERIRVREGLEVEQVSARDLGHVSDAGLLTLVYFDPGQYELRLFTAAEHGDPRPVDRWLEEFGLVAVVNASMYLPNQRSTGLMIDHERSNNPAVNPSFGGFLAFGTADSTRPPWLFAGEDCEGFSLEEIRRDYPVVVQNYRLLDCSGEPFGWSDSRAYSSAAIGRDRRGWLVLRTVVWPAIPPISPAGWPGPASPSPTPTSWRAARRRRSCCARVARTCGWWATGRGSRRAASATCPTCSAWSSGGRPRDETPVLSAAGGGARRLRAE